MTTRNKKGLTQLPFTQFWYNLSRQIHRQSRVNGKSCKGQRHKNSQSSTIRPIAKTFITKQRRLSVQCMHNRSAQPCVFQQKSSIPIKSKQKQNYDMSIANSNSQQQNCMRQINLNLNLSSNQQKLENQLNQNQRQKQKQKQNKDKITNKILYLFQNNVIPFLVDKFIDVEERFNARVKKLQQTIKQQSKQIAQLRLSQKQLKQSMLAYKKSLQDKSDKASPVLSRINIKSRHLKNSHCKCKVLVEAGNSPVNFYQNNCEHNKQNIREECFSRLTTDQHEESIRQLGALLQELTVTIDQSGSKSAIQINNIQKQLKSLAERQKSGQQKLQQQFAQKILDLISTYNDNFVDLDKRVAITQQLITQVINHPKLATNNKALPEKQRKPEKV